MEYNDEEWRPVKNYEGFYEVSSFGRIRGLDRYVLEEKGTTRFVKGKILKPWNDSGDRYLMIMLCKNGEHEKRLMHRLVAEAFIPNPNGLPEVDHIDHDTKNNNVTNLRWVTHRENLHHSYETMSPVRNYRACTLVFPDGSTMDFDTVTNMRRYRDEHNLPFGRFAIDYYGKSGGYTLIKH